MRAHLDRRFSVAALMIFAALALSGCRSNSCRPGTLLLTVQLDAATARADSLRVSVMLGGSERKGAPLAHKAGVMSGTVEVDFKGAYPSNQSGVVTVDALSGGSVIGSGTQALTLSGTCKALSLAIAGKLGDGGIGDLGPACSADSCPSGFCVDGVCCDSPCSGQCEACDVAGAIGTCTPVSGAPHGQRSACSGGAGACGGTCDGSNRTGCAYPGTATSCGAQSCSGGNKILAVNCDGAGNCPTAPSLQCTPATCNAGGSDCLSSCSGDGDCTAFAGKPHCDHGVCTAHLPNGGQCATTGDCNSGNCVDGYCCDQACAGECQACDLPGALGTCTPVVMGAPHNIAAGLRSACPGSGSCAGSCAAGQTLTCTFTTVSCAGGTCSNGTNTPTVFCNGGSCPSVVNKVCDNGLACNGTATGCLTGLCGVDTDCQTGFYCNAAGACTAVNHKGDACKPADCKGQSNCRQCDTGNCVDGYCCDSSCTGDCQACDVVNLHGTCSPVVKGDQPHGARKPSGCGGSGSCAGACDPSDVQTCTFPTGQCVAQSCSGGTVTFASTCKSGSCVAPVPATHGCGAGQVCSGASCGGCTNDAQCGGGNYCTSAGTCAAQRGAGLTCGLKSGANADCYGNAACNECATGFCVDGYCCNTICNGQCQSCNANPGSCQVSAKGTAPVTAFGTRSACGGSGACQQVCDGSDATVCGDPNPDPVCVAQGCSAGIETVQAQCKSGSCPSAATKLCAPYVCDAAGQHCLGACTVDSDCIGGDYCDVNGACQKQVGQGGVCGLSGTSNAHCYGSANCAECATGNCVDGYCCDGTCTGGCQVCNGTGSSPAGTCGPAPAGVPSGIHSCGTAATAICRASCDGSTETCNYPTGACRATNGCSGSCERGSCVASGTECAGTTVCCPCGCIKSGTSTLCAICKT